MDIFLTLTKILNQLFEIVEHQFTVLQDLCLTAHLSDLVGVQVSLVVEDAHCVGVFLTEEEDVKTSLLKIIQVELEWKFTEDGALLKIVWVWLYDLNTTRIG